MSLASANGVPENFCLMVALGDEEANRVQLTMTSESALEPRSGSVVFALSGESATEVDLASPWEGVHLTATREIRDGLVYAKVCLDFSGLTSPLDADSTGLGFILQAGRLSTDGTICWSNPGSGTAILNDPLAAQCPDRVALKPEESATPPAALSFRGTIARFGPGQTVSLQPLSGALGVYRDGVLQGVTPILDGVLSLDLETDTTSTWEISTIVDSEFNGSFKLRFEVVGGYLRVYDESRNDQEVPYFENPDGTYRLDYWNYQTRVYICGAATETISPLISPAYWQIQE